MPVLRVRANGYVIIFYYDRNPPELLHIWARHMMTPDQVIDVFFDKGAITFWNDTYERFETRTSAHFVYWSKVPGIENHIKIFSAGRN